MWISAQNHVHFAEDGNYSVCRDDFTKRQDSWPYSPRRIHNSFNLNKRLACDMLWCVCVRLCVLARRDGRFSFRFHSICVSLVCLCNRIERMTASQREYLRYRIYLAGQIVQWPIFISTSSYWQPSRKPSAIRSAQAQHNVLACEMNNIGVMQDNE